MSWQGQSLLNEECLSEPKILALFKLAQQYRRQFREIGQMQAAPSIQNRVAALLFFEPSTRTRCSFTMACQRLNLSVLQVGLGEESSLAKGETPVDTLRNVAALNPDVLIVRAGADQSLLAELRKQRVPVISAGVGACSHPTQALLDAFTIFTERGEVSGSKILIMGDLEHSRVARSNIKILQLLGAEVGLCGPESFMLSSSEWKGRCFANADEALAWADVCMVLRVQKERHSNSKRQQWLEQDYVSQFQINSDRLKFWREDGLLLHPGPVNWGVELSEDLQQDPRNLILTQVENGVYVRAALLTSVLGGS